jgi:hypothetical protein
MTANRWRVLQTLVLSLLRTASVIVASAIIMPQLGLAQENCATTPCTSDSQQHDSSGALNPIRTSEIRTDANGRVVDQTSTETLGPDGRYIPFATTEKESVRIDSKTVRNTERSFGRGPDGQRVLIQERQEVSSTLADGELKVVRTVSNPDVNGKLQVVQRELQDSKQVNPGVRETSTTVFTPDSNGRMSASVQIEEREKQKTAGEMEFTKATRLSDGSGGWVLSEVRQGSSNESRKIKEEKILRPDAEGKMAIVERTVTTGTEPSSGESRDVVETYSVNSPGVAEDGNLQLVQRQTTVRRQSAAGGASMRTTTEQRNPGEPGDGLQVTTEAIDVVRPGANGIARQNSTITTRDSDGRTNTVWIDVGANENSSAIQVDTRSATKPPQ